MIDLDDKNAVLKTQGGDAVLKSIEALPLQLQQSFGESLQINFPTEYKTIKNIVICGMGGSRFAPLIVKELFKNEITMPLVVNDDYNLPGFAGKDSLVMMSSYSGTTEEVITCGKSAFEKGAKVAGIAAGGEVVDFLKKNNLPYYQFDPIHNPSGQPRIGFGYLVGGHIGLLIRLGFLKIDEKQVDLAFKNLPALIADFKIENPQEKNPAKQLATKLYQRYSYYLVSEFLIGVGNGIQNQTNETAKAISSFRIIPELNHHLMEGLKFPEELKNMLIFVLFYSSYYSDKIKKRFAITKDVIEQNKIKTIWFELKGASKLEQALYLMGLGSYMTMYLAALYEQDPSVIPYVDYFKKKLKEI